MQPPITASESTCPNTLLLEFLDGELTSEKEQEIAAHIAVCPACQTQINQQRKILAELNVSFEESVEVPANFSKIVSANARSQVSGIRHPYERKVALLVCVGLLATILVALSFGPLNAVFGPAIVLEKLVSVFGLVFSLLSDIFLGLGIIGRAVTTSIGALPLVVLGLGIGSIAILAIRRNQKTVRVSDVGPPNR